MTQSADDPATWSWTRNGVLVVLDYLWHRDGMRLPRALMEKEIDDWKAQADIADQQIALKGGGTEPRYQLSGTYDLTDPPKAILPMMLEPMDARLFMRGSGGVVIRVGQYEAPTVTFDETNIISYSDLSRGRAKPDIRNEIRAKFVPPESKYIEQEADPWVNQASVDVDGSQPLSLDLTWCPSHRQARARMKVEAYRQQPAWGGSIVTNAYGMNAFEERYVRIKLPELGIDSSFEILKWSFNPLNGNCTFQVHQMPSEAWAWNPETDEGTAPGHEAPLPSDPVPDPPDSPMGLAATLDGETVTISFTAPNDLRVAACVVWRGATDDFESAEAITDALYCSPNQMLSVNDEPGTGEWFYWVSAENLRSERSESTGSVSVTI